MIINLKFIKFSQNFFAVVSVGLAAIFIFAFIFLFSARPYGKVVYLSSVFPSTDATASLSTIERCESISSPFNRGSNDLPVNMYFFAKSMPLNVLREVKIDCIKSNEADKDLIVKINYNKYGSPSRLLDSEEGKSLGSFVIFDCKSHMTWPLFIEKCTIHYFVPADLISRYDEYMTNATVASREPLDILLVSLHLNPLLVPPRKFEMPTEALVYYIIQRRQDI